MAVAWHVASLVVACAAARGLTSGQCEQLQVKCSALERLLLSKSALQHCMTH
jgi:hypothetical protein